MSEIEPTESVGLSPGVAEQLGIHQELTVEQWQFSTPLLPPQVLRDYEAIIPNFGERYMARWESQGVHRQRLESTVVATHAKSQLRGQSFTLVLGVVALLVAGGCGVTGHEAAALGIVGMDFLGLGGVFVYARRATAQELRRKAEEVPEPTRNQPSRNQSALPSSPKRSQPGRQRPNRNKKKRR